MPAFTAKAPGKVILFGEHAVVYGQPAVAVPVKAVQARATIAPDLDRPVGEARIIAPQVGVDALWSDLPPDHPLAYPISLVLDEFGVQTFPAFSLRIHSTIPIASGMGSGAAVSVAIIRALTAFLGRPLPNKRISALAFEVEKLHHGTPSGIDNTVITYEKPLFFIRDTTIERLQVSRPFHLLIADTGKPSPTAIVVGDVRRAWEVDREKYEVIFSRIGEISRIARQLIEHGTPDDLGALMSENHSLLRAIHVSSPELDRLVNAACQAGALGAKLSGGGRGGNMIALVSSPLLASVTQALVEAGARGVIQTQVNSSRVH